MSSWVTYNFEGEIRDILRSCVYRPNGGHHMGKPFMTAYQIAMHFRMRNPQTVNDMGLIIGGKGSGVPISLSQYIARELSTRIKNGTITDIEGGFISNDYLTEISYTFHNERILSSATGGDKDLSIFRYIEAP